MDSKEKQQRQGEGEEGTEKKKLHKNWTENETKRNELNPNLENLNPCPNPNPRELFQALMEWREEEQRRARITASYIYS